MTTTHIIRQSLAACLIFPTSVLAQDAGFRSDGEDSGDWEFFIGAGAGYAPEYEGSDKYETTAFPGFEIVWRDRFVLNGNGLGAFIVNQERFRLSAAVGYGGGRDESDSAYLTGLGNIDEGAVLSLGAQYDLGPLTATADLQKYTQGSEGTLVSIGLQSMVPFGVVRGALLPTGTPFEDTANEQGLALIGGVSMDWADGSYNQSFFGVTGLQAAASGLSQFAAGSGVKSVNVDFGFAKPLGRNWGLTGVVTYSKLLGDAADSPIVKSDDSVSAMLAVGYNF